MDMHCASRLLSSFLSLNLSGSSPTASAYLEQYVEGVTVSHLQWGTAQAIPVTLSFWVYANVVSIQSVSLRRTDQARTFGASYSVPTAATWTYIVITIPGDTSDSTGWSAVMNGGGFAFSILFSVSTTNTLQGSWVTAQDHTWFNGSMVQRYLTTDMSTAGHFIAWTGVQLESNAYASSFAFRAPALELQLAQRFAYTLGATGALGPGMQTILSTSVAAQSSLSASFLVQLPQAMRVTPVLQVIGTLYVGDGSRNLSMSAWTLQPSSSDSTQVILTGTPSVAFSMSNTIVLKTIDVNSWVVFNADA